MDKLTATKYFINVVDTGSFSKTAQLLNLPISTVSRRVKDLEQHLGVKLIKRSTRYLSLTDLGRIYYNQVEQAVRDFDMADEMLRESSTTLSGKLRISALPSYANKNLYPILEKFRKKYPEITIELISTDAVQDLMKDDIDFIIRPTSTPPEHLIARMVDQHKMAIVSSPEYIENNPPIKHWEDIVKHKTVCYGTNNGVMTWHAFKGDEIHEIKKEPYIIYSDTCKILDAVINKEGIALLPEWTYLESLKQGLVEIVNNDWETSFRNTLDQRLYLIYDRKVSQLKRNQTFLKFFLEQIK